MLSQLYTKESYKPAAKDGLSIMAIDKRPQKLYGEIIHTTSNETGLETYNDMFL